MVCSTFTLDFPNGITQHAFAPSTSLSAQSRTMKYPHNQHAERLLRISIWRSMTTPRSVSNGFLLTQLFAPNNSWPADPWLGSGMQGASLSPINESGRSQTLSTQPGSQSPCHHPAGLCLGIGRGPFASAKRSHFPRQQRNGVLSIDRCCLKKKLSVHTQTNTSLIAVEGVSVTTISHVSASLSGKRNRGRR